MRFIRREELLNMIGVSRSTLWRMVRARRFPPPVRITERIAGYSLQAVEAWMEQRARGLEWDPTMAVAVATPLDGRPARRARG